MIRDSLHAWVKKYLLQPITVYVADIAALYIIYPISYLKKILINS